MDWSKVRQFPMRQTLGIVEEFVCSVWTMTGPSGKPLTCELCRVVTGLELRLVREGELYRSQFARGPLASDELAVATRLTRYLLHRRDATVADLKTLRVLRPPLVFRSSPSRHCGVTHH